MTVSPVENGAGPEASPPPDLKSVSTSDTLAPDTVNPKSTSHIPSSPSPPSQKPLEPGPQQPRWNNPSINKWRALSAGLQLMGIAMSDSAQGALIPYYETHYNISYTIVSLLFVLNAAGVILAAFITDACVTAIGRSKTLLLSELFLIGGFVIAACAPPYGVFLITFFLIGLGCGICVAVQNVFCANLVEGSVVLGIAHGMYGLGGVFAPTIATSLIKAGLPWQRFYLVAIGYHIIPLILATVSYHGYEKEQARMVAEVVDKTATATPSSSADTSKTDLESAVPPPAKQASQLSKFTSALKVPTTIIGASFIFAYQSTEVSISGWIISFLITNRAGDPFKVGYVTSGFWTGVTLGRFVVTPLFKPLGEIVAVFSLVTLCLIFQLLCWLIPNWISASVTLAFIGLFLGPIYPFIMTRLVRIVDPRLHTFVIGFITALGSCGGAVGPFGVGALATWKGVWVLHPVCVALYGIMFLSWCALSFPWWIAKDGDSGEGVDEASKDVHSIADAPVESISIEKNNDDSAVRRVLSSARD